MIKIDIKMPKKCDECFGGSRDGICLILSGVVSQKKGELYCVKKMAKKGKRNDCPLKEIK